MPGDYNPTEADELVPLNDAFLVTNLSITTTVALLVVAPLDRRRVVILKNCESFGGAAFFIKTKKQNDNDGGSWDIGCSSPDLSEGYPVPADSELPLPSGPGVTWLVAAAGAVDAQVMEAA